MSKLITFLLLVVLVFGIAVYIFNGSNGISKTVKDGHTTITTKVRGFDYVTD
jgi:hypothetical protein